MGSSHYYRIGAYLKITIKETEYDDRFVYCDNGHQHSIIRRHDVHFCDKCGEKIPNNPKTLTGYRTNSADVMDVTGEQLQDSTPPALYDSDTVIAVSNIFDFAWKIFGTYYADRIESQIGDMPSQEEIDKIICDFSEFHKDDILLVESLESVIAVQVKFGYVLNAEY